MRHLAVASVTILVGLAAALTPLVWAPIKSDLGTTLYLLWQVLPFAAVALRAAHTPVYPVLALPFLVTGTILAQLGTIKTERPGLQLGVFLMPILLTLIFGTDTLPHLARSYRQSRASP